MLWLITYVPTLSPAARASEPVKLSPASKPPAFTLKVRSGSASPYTFVFAAAVTVIGFAVIARFDDTNVMA